jgi:hypothetical protein
MDIYWNKWYYIGLQKPNNHCGMKDQTARLQEIGVVDYIEQGGREA